MSARASARGTSTTAPVSLYVSPSTVSTRTSRLTEVTLGLSPSYGLLTARDVHDWFPCMMREHEEFEVETDRAGELPVPFCSETVRGVMVE